MLLGKIQTADCILPIDVTLSGVRSSSDESSYENLHESIAAGFVNLLEVLGIPGQPQVNVVLVEKIRSGSFLELRINGERCRFPETLLTRVACYLTGALPSPDVSYKTIFPKSADSRLMDVTAGEDPFVEFVCLACMEIVKLQPEVLLGAEQVVALANTLRPSLAAAVSIERLGAVLKQVVRLRISIADVDTIVDQLQIAAAEDWSEDEAGEALISRLRPDHIEIRLPPVGLRVLTLADGTRGRGKFALMRDGLFYELGLRLPQLSFAIDPQLRPQSVAIKINHLVCMPHVLIQPHEFLVDDTVGRLANMDVKGVRATNPANGLENCVISGDLLQRIEPSGTVSWNPMEYIVLCASSDVRQNGKCLLDQRLVREELASLETVLPALHQMARKHASIQLLTRTIRILLDEQVSVRNLRTILEGAIDLDYVIADEQSKIVFDERLAVPVTPDAAWRDDPVNLASFVRGRLKNYLTHKYSRGSGSLSVYLLDPAIENKLISHFRGDDRLNEKERSQIINSVRTEIVEIGASPPMILTNSTSRFALRQLTELEFPMLVILAFSELSPQSNIQPLGRISLR